MKKALMRLILRLAIAVALWAMNDRTKAKISQSVAEKIADLYRALKKREEQQTEPLPDAREETAPGPLRRLINRIRGTDTDFRL